MSPAFDGDKLLDAASSAYDRVLILFAIDTRVRAGEQIALEWGDIDLDSGVLTVRRSSWHGAVCAAKDLRERRVPLSPPLLSALLAHRHAHSPLVFCRPDGSPLTLGDLHKRLWAASRRAGFRKLRWHDLRRPMLPTAAEVA